MSDQPVSEQPVSDQPVSDQPVSDEPAVEGDIKALLEQDAIGHANPASAMQATLTTKPEHQPKVQLHDGTKVCLRVDDQAQSDQEAQSGTETVQESQNCFSREGEPQKLAEVCEQLEM